MSQQETVTTEQEAEVLEITAPVAGEAEETPTQPVETPAAEVAVVEETPATEETAVIEEMPATEETAVAEEMPVVEETVTEASVEETATEEEPASDADPASVSIFNLKRGQHLTGTVKNITPFGAFVDLGLAQDGLVHISELSKQKVEKVDDVVSVGQEIEVWVKRIDQQRGRISLTMVKPIGARLKDIAEDEELEGVVTRLESYGAFININSERDGLVHISQISHEYIKHPEETLAVGDTVMVKVLKVNRKKRQVDLSIKALIEPPVVEAVVEVRKASQPVREPEPIIEEEPIPTAMALAFATIQNKSQEESKAKEAAQNNSKSKKKQTMGEIIARTLATSEL